MTHRMSQMNWIFDVFFPAVRGGKRGASCCATLCLSLSLTLLVPAMNITNANT